MFSYSSAVAHRCFQHWPQSGRTAASSAAGSGIAAAHARQHPLAGIGLASTNRSKCSGINVSLTARAPQNSGQRQTAHTSAINFGRHVGGNRDDTVAAHRHQSQRGIVVAAVDTKTFATVFSSRRSRRINRYHARCRQSRPDAYDAGHLGGRRVVEVPYRQTVRPGTL